MNISSVISASQYIPIASNKSSVQSIFITNYEPPVSTSPTVLAKQSKDNLFESIIKPKLDAMNIDPEYREYVDSQFKHVTPESLKVDLAILENMKKYVDLEKQSIADAKTFHVGDTAEYGAWSDGWEQKLSDWLQSDDPGITAKMREQASLALEMFRQMHQEKSGKILSKSDIIASGNTYKGDASATDPNQAFDTAFSKKTGMEIGNDASAFFAEIFGRENGGADFYKGIYESRFNVGVTGDGGFVGGVPGPRPGKGMPYQYIINEETGKPEGPYYTAGYPAYQAAVAETMGFDVKIDHNGVPLATRNGPEIVELSPGYENEDGEWIVDFKRTFPTSDEVKFVNPDEGMQNYTFATNRENRESIDSVLQRMMEAVQQNKCSAKAANSFFKELSDYFADTFPLDNGDHDVFAYNRGRNYHESQRFYDFLQYSGR